MCFQSITQLLTQRCSIVKKILLKIQNTFLGIRSSFIFTEKVKEYFCHNADCLLVYLFLRLPIFFSVFLSVSFFPYLSITSLLTVCPCFHDNGTVFYNLLFMSDFKYVSIVKVFLF